jgi:hypothetical protein
LLANLGSDERLREERLGLDGQVAP